MKNHKLQCFQGQQVKHYDIEKTKAFNTGKVKYNKVIEQHQVQPTDLRKLGSNKTSLNQQNSNQKQKKATKKRHNMHLEHRPSDEMDLLISEINSSNLGWKADTCKYQKTHPLYGKHCDALNLAQVDEDTNLLQAEEEAANEGFGDMSNPKFKGALEKAQKWMNTYEDAQDIKDSEIPESYDFRNIDGFDFTSKHRDQGHCGSCYTISFTQVMEARLKLKYGKQPPIVSP